MRLVGFDVGVRRTGVAVSDATATLARPHSCLTGANRIEQCAALVQRLRDEPDGVDAIVVGLPRRLDGTDNEQTPAARELAAALAARTGLPVMLQDERLTSVEAEARLSVRERNWRARKRRLDAAAAAIILQDHLDERARCRQREPGGPAVAGLIDDGA